MKNTSTEERERLFKRDKQEQGIQLKPMASEAPLLSFTVSAVFKKYKDFINVRLLP